MIMVGLRECYITNGCVALYRLKFK